jgi:hypothetical protein
MILTLKHGSCMFLIESKLLNHIIIPLQEVDRNI